MPEPIEEIKCQCHWCGKDIVGEDWGSLSTGENVKTEGLCRSCHREKWELWRSEYA